MKEEQKNTEKQKDSSKVRSVWKKEIIIVAALLIISLVLLNMPDTGLTGYAILGDKETHIQELNLEITEDQSYTLELQKSPKSFNLNSVKLSGKVVGEENFNVYLMDKSGEQYLIVDRESLNNEGLGSITGHVVEEIIEINESEEEPVEENNITEEIEIIKENDIEINESEEEPVEEEEIIELVVQEEITPLEIEFSDVCVETCPLFGLGQQEYELIFEIDEGVELEISDIEYSLQKIEEKPPKKKPKINKTEPKDKKSPKKFSKIRNEKKQDVKAKIKLKKHGLVVTEFDNDEGMEINETGTYEVEMEIEDHPIKRIKLNKVNINSNNSDLIKIDDVREEGEYEGWEEIYAIDPTEINFTDAIVTSVAKGTELYKCETWNFTTQKCETIRYNCSETEFFRGQPVCKRKGGWKKIMDLAPGEEYSFTLTPDDPGYAEYNPTFSTPYCSTGESPCIINSSLLKSAGEWYDNPDEPNQPNTIDSCDDGFGSFNGYGVDESVENITIIDYDGTYFGPGHKIGVEAWVYCYNGAGDQWKDDNVGLVYSNSSSSPGWKVKQYILGNTTGGCTKAGLNKIIFNNITLDDVGGNHTVRVYIDYFEGTSSTCMQAASGVYDNDDVVLYVDIPPTTNLLSPANETVIPITSVNITCDATDDKLLSNMTLYWDYTGTWDVVNSTIITGKQNETTFSQGFLRNQTILWNCLACDDKNQCSFAANNWTVTINSSNRAPNTSLVSPLNNTQFNDITDINFNFTAIDLHDPIFSCSIYIDGELINTNSSTQNGTLTNFLVQDLSYGSHSWYINCTDQIVYELSEIRNFEIIDTLAPQWSNNKTSPESSSTYVPGASYQFNTSWTDLGKGMDTVWIEHNFSGVLQNYSISNISSEYYFDITDLPVGTYTWKSYANDSSGNMNMTDQFVYTVNKATPTCSLIFDQNSPLNYNTALTASCSCTSLEGTVKLYRDGTDVTVAENGIATILGVNNYNYVCNITESANYTLASNSSLFIIQQIISGVNLTLDGVDDNITVEVHSNLNATGYKIVGEGNVQLYMGGILINGGGVLLNNLTTENSLGVFNYTVVYPATQNYSSSEETHWVTVVDTTKPVWNNNKTIPSSGSAYIPGSNYKFNVTWTDNYQMGNVWIEHDFSGVLQNYSMNNVGNEYYYYAALAVGTYTWKVYANDTSGNMNMTDQWTYTVTKAVTNLTLISQPSWYVLNGSTSNVSCYADNSEVNVSMYRNGSYIGSSVGGVVSDVQQLGLGDYDYTCNSTEGYNYSSNTESNVLHVTLKNVVTCNLILNPASGQQYPVNLNASCSCTNPETTATMWRNGTNVTSENNTIVDLAAGTYYYVCNSIETDMYEAASDESTYVINKIPTSCSLTFDQNTPLNYNTALTASCNCTSPEVAVKLYRNEIDVTVAENGIATILGVNNHNYDCNITESANYTLASNSSSFTIQQISSAVNLTLDGIDDNVTVEVYSNVNVTGYKTVGEGNVQLYKEGTLINGGGTLLSNLTIENSLGVFNYTVVYLATQNYSSSEETHWVTVIDTTKPVWNNNKTIPSSGLAYIPGANYQFNVTWTDNYQMGSVWIEHNFSGVLQNYSMNNVGSEYYYDYTNLAVGNYAWKVYANDSSGNMNMTDQFVYTVNKATPTCSLTFDQSSPLDYNDPLIVNCSCTSPEGTVKLYRDGTDVTVAENGIAKILGVDSYGYVCNITESQNYTVASNSSSFTIQKISPVINLTLNNIDGNITIGEGEYVNISGYMVKPSTGKIELYRNESLINNGTDFLTNYSQYITPDKNHNITLVYPATQNYSSSYETHFIYVKDIIPPVIVSYDLYPKVVIVGRNVSLWVVVTDNTAVSNYANITLPNSTVITINLDANYTTLLNGRHNVTFFTIDSGGNIVTEEDYFIVAEPVNFTIFTEHYNSSALTNNLTIYFPGTNEDIKEHLVVGNHTDEIAAYIFDLEFKAYDEEVVVRLNGVNMSTVDQKRIGIDKLENATTGYIVTYGINTTINMTNADITLSYNETNYAYEDALGLYKCDNWNFTGQECLGDWEKITSAVQDKIRDSISATVSSFSGFSIKQDTYCGDGSCGSGETCSSCSTDCGICPESSSSSSSSRGCFGRWGCNDWSNCVNGIQERECTYVGNCPNPRLKPEEKQECFIEKPEQEIKKIKAMNVTLISYPEKISIIDGEFIAFVGIENTGEELLEGVVLEINNEKTWLSEDIHIGNLEIGEKKVVEVKLENKICSSNYFMVNSLINIGITAKEKEIEEYVSLFVNVDIPKFSVLTDRKEYLEGDVMRLCVILNNIGEQVKDRLELEINLYDDKNSSYIIDYLSPYYVSENKVLIITKDYLLDYIPLTKDYTLEVEMYQNGGLFLEDYTWTEAKTSIFLNGVVEEKILQRENTLYEFMYNKEIHTIFINEIDKNYVNLTISSYESNYKLKLLETEEIDLQNDGTKDISITYMGEKEGKADLRVRYLSKKPNEFIKGSDYFVLGLGEKAPRVSQPSEIKSSTYNAWKSIFVSALFKSGILILFFSIILVTIAIVHDFSVSSYKSITNLEKRTSRFVKSEKTRQKVQEIRKGIIEGVRRTRKTANTKTRKGKRRITLIVERMDELAKDVKQGLRRKIRKLRGIKRQTKIELPYIVKEQEHIIDIVSREVEKKQESKKKLKKRIKHKIQEKTMFEKVLDKSHPKETNIGLIERMETVKRIKEEEKARIELGEDLAGVIPHPKDAYFGLHEKLKEIREEQGRVDPELKDISLRRYKEFDSTSYLEEESQTKVIIEETTVGEKKTIEKLVIEEAVKIEKEIEGVIAHLKKRFKNIKYKIKKHKR